MLEVTDYSSYLIQIKGYNVSWVIEKIKTQLYNIELYTRTTQ